LAELQIQGTLKREALFWTLVPARRAPERLGEIHASAAHQQRDLVCEEFRPVATGITRDAINPLSHNSHQLDTRTPACRCGYGHIINTTYRYCSSVTKFMNRLGDTEGMLPEKKPMYALRKKNNSNHSTPHVLQDQQLQTKGVQQLVLGARKRT
jgi:hypothetical protein